MEEQQWLKQYIQDASQEAFACLVRRHLPLVYGVAMRQLHDRHLAEDVAQATFALLARKASSIRDAQALPNWLFKAARYASANAMRLRQNRRRHEERAAAMRSETDNPDQHDATWQQILPALEQAMETLGDADRQAILLRFYEDRSLREVGQSLGVSEEAARKRVDRAVLKLRESLAPAGVALGVSVDLAALLTAHACVQAPAGLANTIAATACQAATHAALATPLLKGATGIMSTATAKVVTVAVGTFLLVGGAAVVLHETTGQTPGSAIAPVPAAQTPVRASPTPAPSPAAQPGKPVTWEESIASITIGTTTREELVKLLGEPLRYAWGNATFAPADLPERYVMLYAAPPSMMMAGGKVTEIRFEGPSPYRFRSQLEVGSPMVEIIEALGDPKQIVEGQAIGFEEGVLYRKCRSNGSFDGYYQRSDQGIRLFLANDHVVAMYLIPINVNAGQPAESSAITNAKVDQLQWGKSTREDVVRLIGEPTQYVWGNKTFTVDSLPKDMYIMAYPGGDQIAIRQGLIAEVRFHQSGPFSFNGLKVGSSLADVAKALGQPATTIDGKPIGFKDGVLHRNVQGQPGRGYYQRSDLGVRMFLKNDTVEALYLMPPRK